MWVDAPVSVYQSAGSLLMVQWARASARLASGLMYLRLQSVA